MRYSSGASFKSLVASSATSRLVVVELENGASGQASQVAFADAMSCSVALGPSFALADITILFFCVKMFQI